MANCVRQAAQALPRHRLPPLRRCRRQMRPQQPACAQRDAAGRCAPSNRRALNAPPPPGAHDVVRPRCRRLQPAADVAGVQRPAVRLDRRDDVPLEPLIEPLGRRLVGHRQQDGQRQSGPGPTRRSPTPVPSASGSAPPATTASPAALRRPSPQPRPCAARPGSSSDRQRTTVSRRARESSRSPIEGDEITQSGSSRTALQGEGRPLCNRSSIRPEPESARPRITVLAARPGNMLRQGEPDRRMCAGGSAAQRYAEPRRECTKVRAATPGGQGVSYQRGRQRTTYRTWPAGRSSTSASRSGSPFNGGPSQAWPGHRDHRVRVRTPSPRSRSSHRPGGRRGSSNGR